MEVAKESLILSEKHFVLLPHQEPHFNRIMDMLLSGNSGYIDTSTTGCGKTYVTCMVAKVLELPMLVICPKTVKSVWRKVAAEAGVEIINCITYQSVSSKLMKQPKHGYLHKTAQEKGKKTHYYFAPTDSYRDLLTRGCLLIIDEMQSVRNNTAQYRAVQTLIRTVAANDTSSKFALISATPFDKPQQSINLMKMVGIIQQEKLVDRGRQTGWIELLNYCNVKDVHLTRAILHEYYDGKKRINSTYEACAFILYAEIVRRQFCSAMPLVIDVPCEARNYYCTVPESERADFEATLSVFKHAVARIKNPVLARVAGDCAFGEVVTAMVAIETLKIPMFDRMARKFLRKPNFKVVIAVHYLYTMNTLAERLAEYNPLVLHGGIADEYDREEIIKKFQSNHAGCHRLLIYIASVGGVGISLHDTVGDYHRVELQSPSFNLIESQQNAGRVYRAGTLSKTYIYVLYANAGDNERGIHMTMVKKSRTLRMILEEYTRNNIVLPIDYEEVYETEDI